VKESFYREAEFRATQAEEAKKKAKADIADLTKVLEDKSKELEDVIAEYKGKLEAAVEDRDTARGAAAALREELAALKQQHAKELATEKVTLEGVVLAVQAEKTSFEAFVREMSRQLLGKFSSLFSFFWWELWRCSWKGQSLNTASPLGGDPPSVASPSRGPVPARGESVSRGQSPSVVNPSRGASPRA
jgi:hypothetical protein